MKNVYNVSHHFNKVTSPHLEHLETKMCMAVSFKFVIYICINLCKLSALNLLPVTQTVIGQFISISLTANSQQSELCHFICSLCLYARMNFI